MRAPRIDRNSNDTATFVATAVLNWAKWNVKDVAPADIAAQVAEPFRKNMLQGGFTASTATTDT